jgi:septal ring factor EnvC (AmiA/AmiB activator)
MMEGGTASDLPLLELAAENAELWLKLAEAQDHLIEMAVDAGELQALVEGLQAELAQAREEQDAWEVQPVACPLKSGPP